MNIPETLWTQILALRDACSSGTDGGPILAIYEDGFEFLKQDKDINPNLTFAIFSKTKMSIENWECTTIVDNGLAMHTAPGSDQALVDILRLFVPFCTAPVFFPERPFVVAHMAQTIDGRVATTTGNSKWIGCKENLVHAHRLRALVDGVLVGGATAKLDLPSLDVRHVTGTNPKRIILSKTFDDIASLPVVENRETLLLGADDDIAANTIDPGRLLEKLFKCGIQTILIEGGPKTIGSFLSARKIDLLQLHVSPVLFGSGKPVLTLPAINDVDEAVRFRNFFYATVGDGMMITGQV